MPVERRNKMARKVKAMKKSGKLYAISFGLVGAMVVTGVTALGCAFAGDLKSDDIASKNGYDEANMRYQIEQFYSLEEQHEAGEISDEEFVDGVKDIENLDREEYMFSSEDVSQEARDDYSSAHAMMNAGFGLFGLFGAVAVLAGAGTAYGIGAKASRTSDYPEEPERTM